MARKVFNDRTVAGLESKKKLYMKPDPRCPGHYVRVMPSGHKAYAVITRDPHKLDTHGKPKQKWVTLGNTEHLSIDDAREKARKEILRIKDGHASADPQSFASVSEEWFKRHVHNKKRELISAKQIRGYFDRYFIPEWGIRDFESIRRKDVAEMLDKIEDNSGPSSADHAFMHLSGLFKWYALRDENYVSPIAKGMRKSDDDGEDNGRERILSDDEIRLAWKATGNVGDFIRLSLLTAQRPTKVSSMRWADISDGIWSVPRKPREKGVGGQLRLPQVALEVLDAIPKFASSPYVFPSARGDTYWQAIANGNFRNIAQLDPEDLWRPHDLRRTARSLMPRAGVLSDIAERVLGHARKDVEAIYNRHDYIEEKADALRKLAELIKTIVG